MGTRKTTEPLRPRVAISGSYGGYNLGDEAILHAIIGELRRTMPVDICVFSRDPADTRARHGVHALPLGALGRRDAEAVIRELDLFVLGGGGILYDQDADMYLRDVTIAHEVGTPVMVYAVGAGPLVDRPRRARVRAALESAAVVTVRDAPTQRLLDDIGLRREVVLTADPAFLLEPEDLSTEEILRCEAIDPSRRLVGISVREPGPAAPDLVLEHYHRLVANAADFVVDRYDTEIVFVPMERRKYDIQHSHAVIGRMASAHRATVLKREYTPRQLISLFARFELAMGMRLHFLELSLLAGVPIMALPYASKVEGLIEAMELPLLACARLADASAGQLIAVVSRVWDERESLREHVRRRVPELARRASVNHRLALELLAAAESARPPAQP